MNPTRLLLFLMLAYTFAFMPQEAHSENIKSGVVGQAFISRAICYPLSSCAQPVHAQVTVLVYEKGELVAAVDSDEQGFFEIPLKPGEYVLMPYIAPLPPDSPRTGNATAAATWVTVTKKNWTPTYVLSIFHIF